MKRIYHPWWQWECYWAGMYETLPRDRTLSPERCPRLYAEFLSDVGRFEAALELVLARWPRSCEQFLSNTNINRIAWLGQAAACIDMGIPRCYRRGFKLLSPSEQQMANGVAAKWLSIWEEVQDARSAA